MPVGRGPKRTGCSGVWGHFGDTHYQAIRMTVPTAPGLFSRLKPMAASPDAPCSGARPAWTTAAGCTPCGADGPRSGPRRLALDGAAVHRREARVALKDDEKLPATLRALSKWPAQESNLRAGD